MLYYRRVLNPLEDSMIASVGESLIDRIGDRAVVGGCAFNTALAASRLGAAVTYFGKVSSDQYGSMILERMIDNGVLFDPDLCNAKEPTLCSKVVLDDEGKASYVFDYEGTAACNFTEDELSTSFANETDIDIVFFGSIALLMEPGCKAIVPAINSIASRPRYYLDPNVRPSMARDPEAYRSMILSLVGGCDIVKASDEDIAFLFPGVPMEEAERRLAGLCEWNLIVTRGGGGSSWYTKFFRVDCPAVKVDSVVDTIGCGDTFNAAVLSYLQSHDLVSSISELDGSTIRDILEFASKAAAFNCTREGCDPPLREEL